MSEENKHYCFAGYEHNDGCDCECSPCQEKRKELKRIDFSNRLSLGLLKAKSMVQSKKDEEQKIIDFFQELDIPMHFNGLYIDSKKLYDILNDPKKCKFVIFKLKNKHFW